MKNGIENEKKAAILYDRIAKVYNFSSKLNRYSQSLECYLNKHLPPLASYPKILDAGCGTGLLTMALIKTLDCRANIVGLDLSIKSIKTAHKSVSEYRACPHSASFAQANILALPFPDESFDMVVTCGALEYVPLRDGLREIARVLLPGGYLIYLPVRSSLVSRLLERLFRFKAHPSDEVLESTNLYFRILSHYRFPQSDPISWTKTVILTQRI